MTIHDLPQIKKGVWTTIFSKDGHQIIQILNCHDRIQTEDQATEIAKSELHQFNPKLEWDAFSTRFIDERSL